MEKVIEIKGLSKQYKDFHLDNINLTIPRGLVTGLIGPNGAGKSTLIKLLMNVSRPDSGSLTLFGETYEENEVAIKDRIGFVYDENYFHTALTVDKTKKMIAPFYSRWDEERYQKYVEQFSLNTRKKIGELSKGQRMKFSLALALSHHAELLIMDEPMAGLDPTFRRELIDELRDVMSENDVTVFYSSHHTQELDRFADYVTYMNDGAIVLHERKDQLDENYALVKGPIHLLTEKIRSTFIGLKVTEFGFEGVTKARPFLEKLPTDELLIEPVQLDELLYYHSKGRLK